MYLLEAYHTLANHTYVYRKKKEKKNVAAYTYGIIYSHTF